MDGESETNTLIRIRCVMQETLPAVLTCSLVRSANILAVWRVLPVPEK